MDWTGGVRRRYAAGKNNAMLQKQKAHFAKARAAHHSSKSSQKSFKPRFLQDNPHEETKSRRPRDASESRNRVPPKRERQSLSHQVGSHDSRSRSRHNSIDRGYVVNRPTSSKHASGPRAPSVVYISSRSGSSSAVSVASHQNARERAPQIRQLSTGMDGMDEEERLLLAKRRKLLARTDWLGLTIQRPINMRFQSSRDKDHIGKRRKVKSSASRKGRPAARRAFTPPFRQALWPRDHMMSGALQPDDIRIKIGTDALISQTQPSRHSHTPGKTSMRHPSTESGALSEESMLLGPDEDPFQSDLLYGPAAGIQQDAILNTHSQTAMAGSQMTHALHVDPEMAETGVLHGVPAYNMQYEYDQFMSQNAIATNHQEAVQHSHHVEDTHAMSQHLSYQVESRMNASNHYASQSPNDHGTWGEVRPPVPNMAPEEYVDEDDRWRELFKIQQPSSTHHSIVALKSSSKHLTTSESDPHQQSIERPTRHANDIDSVAALSASKPADTSAVDLPAITANEAIGISSGALQSQSASLKQITKLAAQPTVPSRQAQQDAEDEALWRQFIVGSQDSSDEQGPLRNNIDETNEPENIEPVHDSSAFAVSGLGTSAKSTAGDTLFVNTDTSSRVSEDAPKRKTHRKPKRKPTLSLAPSKDDTATVESADTYLRQPTTIEEEDEIEDVELPPKRSAQANIHAGTTNILNHRRFKPPVKKPQAQAPQNKPNPFRAPRRSRTFAKKGHGVYDLVDSDGASVY